MMHGDDIIIIITIIITITITIITAYTALCL